MRRRVVLAILAVLTVGSAVAACSSTVDGNGSAASGASRGRSAAAPGPTELPSESARVPPSSSTASESSPASSALDCPAGSITARSAPFCYPLPPGFTDYSSQTNYGKGWTYRTLVSVDVHDLIEVLAAHYDDTTSLSDAELRARFDQAGLLKVGEYDIVWAGPVTPTRVAGARGFRQQGRFSGGVKTDSVTIYLGTTVASIRCQSEAHVSQVSTACTTVRSTIRLARA